MGWFNQQPANHWTGQVWLLQGSGIWTTKSWDAMILTQNPQWHLLCKPCNVNTPGFQATLGDLIFNIKILINLQLATLANPNEKTIMGQLGGDCSQNLCDFVPPITWRNDPSWFRATNEGSHHPLSSFRKFPSGLKNHRFFAIFYRMFHDFL